MKATTRAALLVALVALAGAARAQEPADAAGNDRPQELVVRVEPAEVRLRAGQALNVTLVVENHGDRDLTLQLRAADAPELRAAFGRATLKLPAQERAMVPVTVKLAPDAAPGPRILVLGAHEAPTVVATRADHAPAESAARLRVVTPPATLVDEAKRPTPIADAGVALPPPDPSDDATTETATVTDTPDAIPTTVLAIAGAGAAVGAGALSFGWLRKRWGWLLAPLYTRIARSRVLEQPTREALADLVAREPGITFGDAQRKLGIGAGTMTHHARMLEAAGILFSSPDGQTRRLFLVAGGRQAAVAPLHERVLAALREKGPMTAAELARALRVSRQSLHYHVKRLRQEGRLLAEGEGKEARLHAG